MVFCACAIPATVFISSGRGTCQELIFATACLCICAMVCIFSSFVRALLVPSGVSV